jgi:hypothetical protein
MLRKLAGIYVFIYYLVLLVIFKWLPLRFLDSFSYSIVFERLLCLAVLSPGTIDSEIRGELDLRLCSIIFIDDYLIVDLEVFRLYLLLRPLFDLCWCICSEDYLSIELFFFWAASHLLSFITCSLRVNAICFELRLIFPECRLIWLYNYCMITWESSETVEILSVRNGPMLGLTIWRLTFSLMNAWLVTSFLL